MYCKVCKMKLVKHTLTQLRQCQSILLTERNRERLLKEVELERNNLMNELHDDR